MVEAPPVWIRRQLGWEAPLLLLVFTMLAMHFFFYASVQIGGIHIYAIDGAVALTYLAGLIRVVLNRRLPRLGWTEWALVAFVGIMIIAAAVGIRNGHQPKSAFNDLKIAFYLGTLFPARVLLARRPQLARVLAFAGLLILVAALYDVFSRITGKGYYPFSPADVEAALSSGFYSRAYGLVTALPYYGLAVAFALVILSEERLPVGQRIALFVLSAGLILLILLQLLRGLMLGLIVVVPILLLYARRTSVRLRLLLYTAGLVVTVTALAAVLPAPAHRSLPGVPAAQNGSSGPLITDVGERSASIVNGSASTVHASQTLSWRLRYIFQTLSDLRRGGQLLLGRGLGYLNTDRQEPSPGVEPFYPTLAYHSAPGWLLSKTGFAGIVAFGALLLVFARTAYIESRSRIVFDRIIVLGAVAGLGFLTVTSLGENYLLQYSYTTPVVGLLFAIPGIIGEARVAESDKQEQPTDGLVSAVAKSP